MTGTPVGSPKGPERFSGARGKDEGSTSASQFAGLGLQMAVCIIGGLYLGQWLDGKLGTAPWLLISGVFLGAGASFYSMYRKLMAAQAREEAARKAKSAGPQGGPKA
jgi:F0F1-type ATP synthase assembly protein I